MASISYQIAGGVLVVKGTTTVDDLTAGGPLYHNTPSSTVVFRKTRSVVGTRVGSRQGANP